MSIEERLAEARLVPVIALPRAEDAVPLCEALGAGGLRCAEMTFRTAAGREGLKLAVERFPDFLVGAGTVTTPEEAKQAADAGARFAVAPGTNPHVIETALAAGLPFSPGVCTPSDIEAALACGVTLLKFFPAEAAGGVKFLKAIAAPYKHRGVRFVPTGGINEKNAAAYLAMKEVVAVGGSWIVASELLEARDWKEVERRTAIAMAALKA
ncbi:MAG: 2-dehydro-3-deoxyphosphogluconate aldolase / (4S)-4-hydroxy-2-oxoglutarate aldolase [Candidatus Sumerlaeota bacterium]|nr:2-dehydro-3-deoxyphosphogluconate aldolase / (4S)-4-hydroxy-2-oxoglutarate aldolase [Candidatus Sumerlaeota bacterium]